MEAEKPSVEENLDMHTRNILQNMEKELQNITKGLSELTDTAKSKAKEVDKHIHNKPYWYLAGAAGVGYFLAKLKRHH